MAKGDTHSLNAQVDEQAYREYQYIVKQESSTVNKFTEKVIKKAVKDWKRKNGVDEIPEAELEKFRNKN